MVSVRNSGVAPLMVWSGTRNSGVASLMVFWRTTKNMCFMLCCYFVHLRTNQKTRRHPPPHHTPNIRDTKHREPAAGARSGRGEPARTHTHTRTHDDPQPPRPSKGVPGNANAHEATRGPPPQRPRGATPAAPTRGATPPASHPGHPSLHPPPPPGWYHQSQHHTPWAQFPTHQYPITKSRGQHGKP